MARNVILLNGNAREEDKIASEILTPGELVQPAATEGQVQANATAGDTDAPKTWVREQVENAGAGATTNIASGDTCTVLNPEQGAKINARIAHGQTLSDGDALESDGAGALRAHTSGRILAFAAEDITNVSGSAGLFPVIVA